MFQNWSGSEYHSSWINIWTEIRISKANHRNNNEDVQPINYLNNLNQYLSRDGHKLFVSCLCVYTEIYPIADQKNQFRTMLVRVHVILLPHGFFDSYRLQSRFAAFVSYYSSLPLICRYIIFIIMWSNGLVINRSYLSSRYLFDGIRFLRLFTIPQIPDTLECLRQTS